MTLMTIQYELIDEKAKAPQLSTPGSTAYDLFARTKTILLPGEVKLIPLNIRMAIPPGIVCLLMPRSSLCIKKNVVQSNSVGLIDYDFRGEVMLPVLNVGKVGVTITDGEKVAQLLFFQGGAIDYKLTKTTGIPQDTGHDGFGSTGGYTVSGNTACEPGTKPV